MITIVWMDEIPCISLPTGVISFADSTVIIPNKKPKINIKTTTKTSKQKDFTRIQRIKEDICFNDLLKELKDRFKEQKD
ncbi:MAG: hypothetical protein ACW98A_16265 [Candidatus Hodarchaeales archaeon]|jgi:hypothetical protein